MRYSFIPLLVLFLMTTVLAQLFDDGHILDAQLISSYDEVTPGLEFPVVVVIDIQPGLHINANVPSEDYLIPTEIRFAPHRYFSIGHITYPPPLQRKFSFSDKMLSVYEGNLRIYVDLQAAPDVPPGEYLLKGTISYQGCNDSSCFSPAKQDVSVTIRIVPAGTTVSPKNSDWFVSRPLPKRDVSLTEDENQARGILEHGLFYAIIAFFLVGLALNLTPCVYPVIPLTVSYFGSRSDQSRSAAFLRGLAYLAGIAVSFALLGILSALAGKQWGFLFQSPWFVAAIACIILLMAASMFGAFEISVPSGLLTKFGRTREGVLGAFIMGLTVGVIIAPCAAGIIIGLVGLIAKLGLVFTGGLLFFVMGIGLGLPYLVLATFSGLLNHLPQSGMWMMWIKKFFGFLLIAVAFYFIVPQIERMDNQLSFLLGILGIVGGLILGFLDQGTASSRGFKLFKGIVGVLLLIAAGWQFHAATESKPTTLPWQKYSGQSLEAFTAAGKPIFIDFYADWCAPCKQLERQTFSDARVIEAFAAFTLIKVDCTKPDAATRSFMEKFQVSGMPTLIFLTPQGREIKSLREIGFISPEKFLHSLQTAVTSE